MRHYYADKIDLYIYIDILYIYICSRLRIASCSFSNEKFYLPKVNRSKFDLININAMNCFKDDLDWLLFKRNSFDWYYHQFDIDQRYFTESYDEEIQLVLWTKQIIKKKNFDNFLFLSPNFLFVNFPFYCEILLLSYLKLSKGRGE